MPKRRFLLLPIGALAASSTLGFLLSSPAAATPAATPPVVESLCRGGAAMPFALALAPAVDDGALAVTIRVAAEDLAGRARWVLELVDDVGAPVQAPVRSETLALPPHASREQVVRVPGLRDGHFAARVTLVARTGDHAEAPQTATVYFVVADGEALPMDPNAWHAESRANVAVQP